MNLGLLGNGTKSGRFIKEGAKRDIIFSSLPPLLEIMARLFVRRGHRVFYVSLGSTDRGADNTNRRVLGLHASGIVPLPIEQLEKLVNVYGLYCDKDELLDSYVNNIAPESLINSFRRLYRRNSDIAKKLHIFLKSAISGRYVMVNPVVQWANANPDRRHVLIFTDATGHLVQHVLPTNVTLVVFPVETINRFAASAIRCATKIWDFLLGKIFGESGSSLGAREIRNNSYQGQVAFVTHQGLSYGKMYDKNLWYSTRLDSELHPENIIHLDYSGYDSPSERVKWVSLRQTRLPMWIQVVHLLRAVAVSIRKARRFGHFIGVVLLARCYLSYKFYCKSLEGFEGLTLALIDYEILCPKGLLLALEAKRVRTVAAQERFIVPFYVHVTTILDTYLCASDFICNVLKKTTHNKINNILPVGQYRGDMIYAARKSAPPDILQEATTSRRKIVIALGYDAKLQWHESQVDPLLNWSAHIHFLEDMVHLATDIPDIFLVLRYKSLDWIDLPEFQTIVHMIKLKDNMAISKNYEQAFYSYHLCAHSHLVIAKQTSLADECLAFGIPVLFHDYTHNASRIAVGVFDYCSTKVMCFNYEQLLARSRMVLCEGENSDGLKADYVYLKEAVYGNCNDGSTISRIQSYVESAIQKNPMC